MELANLKTRIDKFAGYYDIQESYHYYTLSKQICESLDKLVEEGNKLNFKENCLNFELSELGEVVEVIK